MGGLSETVFIEYYTNFLCITAEMTLAGIVDTLRESITEFTDHHTEIIYVNSQLGAKMRSSC